MGTRFDHKGLYEPRVDTVTDIIGDTAQQQVKELFAPRIAKLSRNALNVMPFPFEFFQRIRGGRRCSCFSVEDDPAAQCHVCFVPGTLVRTSDGYRPIESIRTGDFVLSGDGSYQRVREVMVNPFDGNLSSIQSSVGSNPILATPDHPFLAMGGYHHKNPKHALTWQAAKDITETSWLKAQWPSIETDLRTIFVPTEFQGQRNRRRGPDQFTLDEEFLWVIGLYLAEGSCGSRTIIFSLHEDEVQYQQRLFAFFKRYGYTPALSRRSYSRGVDVRVHCSTLASWFPAWLGRGCQNKRIPEEIMRLPAAKLRSLLRGVHDGDGSKSCLEITQTSEVLALQLVEILHRLGQQPLLRQQQSTRLTPKGNKRRLAYCVSWEEMDTFHHDNRRGRWRFNGSVLAKVRTVKHVPYKGPVYNLEVEGEHTYVVNGVVVHNCFGTGVVGGYVKRGCRLHVLDVTSLNVRCVNVAPDYRRQTRPTGFALQPNTTYGYLETEIEIHQNIGVLDHLMVKATTLHGAYVEPYIRSPVDEDWIPLTEDAVTRRLGYRHLGLRVVFRRQGPSDPYPSLATIRICYASIPNRTVRADIPRVTESKTLEDFGIYESFSSQTFFLDAELKNITTEDFFYAVLDGTRWKCIETKANVIAGVNTSWDLICRLVQSYEPMMLIPAGKTLEPAQRPPASIISIYEAPGSPWSKEEARKEPLPLQLNAGENTPWRQDPAPYKHVQHGLIAEESMQVDKDSKKT